MSFRSNPAVLGWKTFDEGRRGDRRWCLYAKSCGHTIVALGDAREEVWSAVCSMPMNLTAPSLRKRRE
jgi:hypothetical protein